MKGVTDVPISLVGELRGAPILWQWGDLVAGIAAGRHHAQLGRHFAPGWSLAARLLAHEVCQHGYAGH